MRDHRQVVEGVIYRYRCGLAWRDLPASFGPWQTVWKRHRRFSEDGTWDKIHQTLLAQADHAGEVDWTVSVDSTINRAHQHATNLPREKADAVGVPRVPGVPGSLGRQRARGPHRGLSRTTRIRPIRVSLQVNLLSGALRRAGPPRDRTLSRRAVHPRSTSSSTAADDRLSCWSVPARPTTPRCSPCCWSTFASSGADLVGHAPDRTRSSVTRPIPRVPTASCCAPAGSRR